MTWGDKIYEDPRADAYGVKGNKGKKAIDAYYTSNLTATGLNTKDIQNRKIAITELMSTLPSSDIKNAMRFDDPEASFTGLKEMKGKSTAECLSIIFSGAYNQGTPCFTEEYTPYDLVYDNLEYTAILKHDWKRYFPSIVIMQRNVKIGRSLLERFCTSTNKLTKSSSSSSSYVSASYVTPLPKCEEEIYNEENINDFTSYLKTSNDTLTNAKYISMSEHNNNAIMKEYCLDTRNKIDKVGTAMVIQSDLSMLEFDFNISLTVKQNRKFHGVTGTHEWKIYKSVEKVGVISLAVGDYVVVLGIERDRVHIQDPNYDKDTHLSDKIKSFVLNPDNFYVPDVNLHASPESI
jgi:hypothetical protein